MLKNKNIIALVFAVLSVTSCTKNFEEINSNPNFPESATPDLLLVNLLRSSAFTVQAHAYEYAGAYSQQVTKFDYNDYERFAWGGNSNYWNDLYATFRDAGMLLTLADEEGNDSYKGIAMIMKAYVAAQITEMYGDVPYFNASKAKDDNNFTPAYDAQKDIYTASNGILDLLERGAGLVASSKSSISGDIIYDGDMAKWEKFANSLRLRYLLRISSKENVKAEMSAIVSEGNIMTGNADNAVLLSLSSKPNQGYVSMLRYGDYNLWRMTTSMDSIMSELNDPRKSIFFDPAGVGADGNPFYAGFPVGITDGTEADMGVDQNQTSRLNEERFYTNVTAVNYDMMKAAEIQFILAEAALIGLVEADAEDFYYKGIELALADAEAGNEGYVNSASVKYNRSYALNQIITQKWLANFMVGIEGWCEFKRTGYPVLHENIDNKNYVNGTTEIPSRYYYPADEQVYNKENYNAQVSKMGGKDDINYSLWWE